MRERKGVNDASQGQEQARLREAVVPGPVEGWPWLGAGTLGRRAGYSC